MPRWEYRKLELSSDQDLKALAAAGLDGWELEARKLGPRHSQRSSSAFSRRKG
jgi:hypothetical protein